MTPNATTSGLLRLAAPGWTAGCLLSDFSTVGWLFDRSFLLGFLLDDLELEDLGEPDLDISPPRFVLVAWNVVWTFKELA
jgi:hypothetical protein